MIVLFWAQGRCTAGVAPVVVKREMMWAARARERQQYQRMDEAEAVSEDACGGWDTHLEHRRHHTQGSPGPIRDGEHGEGRGRVERCHARAQQRWQHAFGVVLVQPHQVPQHDPRRPHEHLDTWSRV